MSDYSDGGAIAFALIFGFFSLLIAIAFYVVFSFFLMRVFDKAGVQGKWRAWIPVYNTMVFCKLGDLSPWLVVIAWGALIVLGWVPGIGFLLGVVVHVIVALAAWRVGLKLQKEAVWVILYIFLAPVWLGILAFDRSRWSLAVPPAPWAGNSFLSDSTTWAGIPGQRAAGGPGYGAPGAPQPPVGYQPPAPTGYQPAPPGFQTPPPAGYQAPPAPGAPPAQQPPAPAAPPAGAEPPASTPPAPQPPTPDHPASEPPPSDPPASEPPQSPRT